MTFVCLMKRSLTVIPILPNPELAIRFNAKSTLIFCRKLFNVPVLLSYISKQKTLNTVITVYNPKHDTVTYLTSTCDFPAVSDIV